MIRWEKEGAKASSIARYSLGLTSLDAVAKGLKLTTLEAMQVLRSAGLTSRYALEDYRAEQAILKSFLDYRPPTNGSKKVGRAAKPRQGGK